MSKTLGNKLKHVKKHFDDYLETKLLRQEAKEALFCLLRPSLLAMPGFPLAYQSEKRGEPEWPNQQNLLPNRSQFAPEIKEKTR